MFCHFCEAVHNLVEVNKGQMSSEGNLRRAFLREKAKSISRAATLLQGRKSLPKFDVSKLLVLEADWHQYHDRLSVRLAACSHFTVCT
jgi:hypothetical protein